VWTAVQAVHAEDAFTYAYFFGWLAGSLAISVTKMTATAFAARFSDTYSPKGKGRQYAKKCSEGTNEPAVKAGNLEVK
jgi:hypothetical protein